MSRHAAILAADAAAGRRHAALATVVLAVAIAALGVSGFFDAERFADGVRRAWRAGERVVMWFSDADDPTRGAWYHGEE